MDSDRERLMELLARVAELAHATNELSLALSKCADVQVALAVGLANYIDGTDEEQTYFEA